MARAEGVSEAMVRRVWRDELRKQAAAEDGCVVDPQTGESSKVAEVRKIRPTGAFALSADPYGERSKRILAALRAGELAGLLRKLLLSEPFQALDPAPVAEAARPVRRRRKRAG